MTTKTYEHSPQPRSFSSDISYESTVPSHVRTMMTLTSTTINPCKPDSIMECHECCELRVYMILRFCFRACGELFECRNGLCHCYFGSKNIKQRTEKTQMHNWKVFWPYSLDAFEYVPAPSKGCQITVIAKGSIETPLRVQTSPVGGCCM